MVDFQDPNLIAIIIIDILGISIFIWFLASRLSMKFKVIEERKSKKKKNNVNIENSNQSQDPPKSQN
ncbi:MAG: hypothetical protein QF746_00565 [Candidatus Thalassarchaeaceae archaeon]|jgi:hypothetical protein|nr:hypothetical protein [Candidatus Thalassarchaeaceae archaeon]MEC8044752.1 hypothetical protein [Candidatus Thermoplasmatota archaeon]|tara:strand:- start:19625 stop:19825 length:201 start_codon:yes stop_codon:yes gene_type:complete